MPDLKSGRLVSLDAYRGLIMLTLAASGFGLLGYANNRLKDDPDSALWHTVKFHTDHPEWVSNVGRLGVSFWDLIQPSFMFMVGVSMPFSYTRRFERGDSYWAMARHALFRSIVLVLLGVFLESTSAKSTNWHFPCVLSQIGLGYMVLFFLMGRPWPVQLIVGTAILAGYWYWFVWTPGPGAESMQDFAAHFGTDVTQKNQNAAAFFDQKYLSMIRDDQYLNKGGYATLNFVPSIVTMLFGLMCGEMLQGQRREGSKLAILFVGGAVLMGLAQVVAPYCPIVKRIWTPSWVLFSGAYVLWMLGALYAIIDVIGWKRWAFPLVVLGVNSILLYLMGQLLRPWVAQQIKIHFEKPYEHLRGWLPESWNLAPTLFSGNSAPIVQATAVMAVFWLICYWLYRQRLFVRI
jgi:heparan-alpha-glucosaminide N-acetyltransferase